MPQAVRRKTKQAEAVSEYLSGRDNFVSAQDLHAELRTQGHSVGLATVYRILQRMAEDGEVDVVRAEDTEALYRKCGTAEEEHHHHMVCRSCGFAAEFEAPDVEKWMEGLAQENGFTNTTHVVEMYGTCRDCAGGSETHSDEQHVPEQPSETQE